MLTAGVLGFFALSGDFGAAPKDVPPTDGWQDRASADPIKIEAPDLSSPQAVTVRREPTGPQDGHNWSNPAEGEIVQTPPGQSSPGVPNFMTAPGLAETQNHGSGSTTSPTGAGEGQTISTARPTSLETTELAPPQNAPDANAANGASSPYPTTGAAGLSPLTMPGGPGPQIPYTGAATVRPPQSFQGPPSYFGAAASAGPAVAAPMTYPSRPGYPTTAAHPSSAYPATNASEAPFPNNLPSAMSPRYERIR
jgi:hypothetical protein